MSWTNTLSKPAPKMEEDLTASIHLSADLILKSLRRTLLWFEWAMRPTRCFISTYDLSVMFTRWPGFKIRRLVKHGETRGFTVMKFGILVISVRW